MWVPLSFVFVFFYSYAISDVLALSHSAMCPGFVLIPTMWKAWAFGLVLPPFIPSWAWTLSWQKLLPVQPVGLPFLLLLFLPCLWACHVDPLDLSPLPLGSYDPFTLLLPLVVSMGLLVVILVMLAHWIYYLFSWASTAYLLYFYFLLCPWACWLSFLPCWPIGFITSFLGLPRLIYFTFTSYYAHGPASYHSFHVGRLSLLPFFLGLPQPIYFTFTSYCAHGPVICHLCHVGPLGQLSLCLGFHDSFTLLLVLPIPFFSHLTLLLGFLSKLASATLYGKICSTFTNFQDWLIING